jgi:hypothetical protein
MNNPPKKPRVGFIEVFVVTIVIAVFAGLAVPIMSQVGSGPETDAGGEELQAVQDGVDAMMRVRGISALPDPGPDMSGSLRSTACASASDMSVFPYTGLGEMALLGGRTGDYVEGNTTRSYYVDASGKVHPGTGDCE